ncbi:hypothetical protein Tco_0185542 [Tanacetum coccineum]
MILNHSDDILSCSVPDLNSNQTDMDQELGGAANDLMSICSRPDMHNAEVSCDRMAIDKPDQMNDYKCSQPIPSSVDALIQACAYAGDHPKLDVLQHEAHVDRSGPKINQHPTVEALTAIEFRDDYMSVLNEEIIPNVSLDDMKFQHEEENFPVKDTPLEPQPVDELIDAQKDTTNLLPENVKDEINKSKYVNVVKANYKPPLETVFAANIKSKKKKCGLQKNYVLRSIQERKKRLAMALELSGRMDCNKGKCKLYLDEISEFLKMQDPPEYWFPLGFRDLTVDRLFWLQLACLDLAKKGWLGDSHLDCWVDLMWSFREPDADWAMGFAAALAVLIIGASQNRQHGVTSLIRIESHKSPTMSLFDVGSSRISIFIVNKITRMFWQNHKDNAKDS